MHCSSNCDHTATWQNLHLLKSKMKSWRLHSDHEFIVNTFFINFWICLALFRRTGGCLLSGQFLHLIQWLWWFFCRALEHLRSRVGITPSLSSRSTNPSRCRPLAISRKESRLKARPQEISPGVGCPMIFLWFLCIYVCLWLSVHFLGGTNCPA